MNTSYIASTLGKAYVQQCTSFATSGGTITNLIYLPTIRDFDGINTHNKHTTSFLYCGINVKLA